MVTTKWIPQEEWETIVRNVPVVSVDLLVRYRDGIVFGKRVNEPAKGSWFVPGGRIFKGETRREAVNRIAADELGLKIEIVESLGAFEHFYQTSDVDDVESKHYLANGYVVDAVDGALSSDAQHTELRVFDSPPDGLHEHVADYVRESEYIDWQL
jgi:colanic acid biosynthesis protein WcaH